ncbi:hypothetical protein [Zarconia navalis]|nr:hypothetical protein [Zarconia navalis]
MNNLSNLFSRGKAIGIGLRLTQGYVMTDSHFGLKPESVAE